MRQVWKFPLAGGGETKILMPPNTKVVHFDMQFKQPHLWAVISSGKEWEERMFRIFGTGDDVPADWAYVATCLDPPFVWHLFEKMR